MKLVELSVKKPVATLMVFLGVVLLGFISLGKLSIDLLPNLSFPKLSVVTELQGASPEEVEKLITTPLESSLAPIPGVKRVTSVSREGISVISLEFHWGTDMNFALLHTKEKVEEVKNSLPEDSQKPRIVELDPTAKPIVIAVVEADARFLGTVRGSELGELRETTELLIKPRLEQLEGVSRAEVQGSGEREVVVEIIPEKLTLFGVSYDDVATAIKNWNQMVLGGMVRKDNIRYSVKVEGEIKEADEIAAIPVKNLPTGQIRVRDIGSVRFREKIKQGEIRYDRRASIALMIYKEASGNTVSATDDVRRAFRAMEKEFPGLRFHIVSEEAGMIVSAISNLKQALVQGGILAFMVLLIFFQNLRDPILVALVSPISVLATFVLMYFAGVNLNIMSLGGLALGIGIFMDNAIVVIENMFRRHSEEKESPERAAILGTRELVSALVGSSLTTIVIFLPVIYIYGITGRLFRDQSLTISFALVAAYVVTITLLPTLFRLFSPGGVARDLPAGIEPDRGRFRAAGIVHSILAFPLGALGFILEGIVNLFAAVGRMVKAVFSFLLGRALNVVYRGFNRVYDAFAAWYHDFLIRCLDKKSIAGWITLAMLVGTVIFYLPLKRELLPQTQTSRFEIIVTSAPMLGYEETEQIGSRIEQQVKAIPAVSAVFSRLGATGSMGSDVGEVSTNRIEMIVECRGRGMRDEAMRAARRILASIEDIDQFSVFPERNTLSEYLRFGANEFQVKVFYESIAQGNETVNRIRDIMKRIPGVVDIRANIDPGKPVLAIRYNESLLEELGVSKKELSDQIRNALRGDVVSALKKFQKTYDIVVSSPIREQHDLDRAMRMPVRAGKNTVPLGQLVQFNRVDSIKEITRESQERFFLLSANLQGTNAEKVAARLQRELKAMALPAGIRVNIAGEEEERRAAFRSVGWALLLSIVLVYMVMAAEFENLVHPLLIMSTIPMGLFGAFVFLFFLGESINVISGIGMMVAVGIVVDDAIVKLECANQLRESGMSVRQALLGASRLRLKPIILNTFTTVFGVFPMIYMSGVGAELQRPMAVVMAGSLLSSTFLTLILIPVLYEMFTRDKKAPAGDTAQS